jgi:purine-binding chemotaxis protein CheW
MSTQTETTQKASSERLSQEHTETKRTLVFKLGNEHYSILLSSVREVLAVPDIRPLPQTPPHLLGVMNIRGNIIPVIDLRLKMKMPVKHDDSTQNTETAVIILDLESTSIGIVVTAVDQVMSVEPKEIAPPPDLAAGQSAAYITGIVRKDKRLILMMDVGRALADDIKAAKRVHAA